MEKTFTFAGTSILNGTLAYRFANGADRTKVLERNGHTDIKLLPTPYAMTKEQAIDWLNAQEIYADANRVTSGRAGAVNPSTPRKRKSKDPQEGVMNDEGFIEPEDERIQVDMTRTLKQNPGLSRREAYETVMLARGYEVERSF